MLQTLTTSQAQLFPLSTLNMTHLKFIKLADAIM